MNWKEIEERLERIWTNKGYRILKGIPTVYGPPSSSHKSVGIKIINTPKKLPKRNPFWRWYLKSLSPPAFNGFYIHKPKRYSPGGSFDRICEKLFS